MIVAPEEVKEGDDQLNEYRLSRNEQDLAVIAKFRMFDDTFMSAVFDGQIAETELLLRIVLEREDIIVISSKAQYFISNYTSTGSTEIPKRRSDS